LTKPDDGHIRPKHVVLLQILRIYIFYTIYELLFLTTLPPTYITIYSIM